MSDAAELSHLTIGQVLRELQAEFPALTITKIRYLETEGLIEPQRTPSRYRKFTFADVERLRLILRHQAAVPPWPLSHIRQLLDDMDNGRVPAAELGRTPRVPHLALADDGLPTDATFLENRSQLRLSRADLLDASGLDDAMLQAVEEFGLITRRPTQTYYDGDDLQVASLVAEFAELGLEPRHLRHFATQADREAGLVDQVVSPRAKNDQEGADRAAASLAALSVRLHTVLLRNRLRG